MRWKDHFGIPGRYSLREFGWKAAFEFFQKLAPTCRCCFWNPPNRKILGLLDKTSIVDLSLRASVITKSDTFLWLLNLPMDDR